MIKKARYIKILLLLTAFIFFSSCENDIKEVQQLGLKNTGIEEGRNIESFFSTGGKTKARLTSPLMIRSQFDSAKTEFPNSLHVEFFDSALQKESFLFAKYGKYSEFNNTVLLKDSVMVWNIKNDTLWCNELWWDQNKAIFYTDKPVVVSQNNFSIRQKIFGRGLRSDQSFKNLTILKIGNLYSGNDNFIILKDSTL